MPPKKGQKKTAATRANAKAARSSTRSDDTLDTLLGDTETVLPSSLSPPRVSSKATGTPAKSRRTETSQGPPESVTTTDEVTLIDGLSVGDYLLARILDGGALDQPIETLLHVYKHEGANAAICGVLNLAAKASGVSEVELDGNALIDGIDITPLLDELYARVHPDSAAYMLVNKEAKYKKFRRSFLSFFEKLVTLAFSEDVLLQPAFLPTLSQWFIAISESKSRGFRHTATAAILGMVEGLNRLQEHQRGRLGLSRNKSVTADTQKGLDDITEWRDHLFSQCVHQRLRDVAPEVRLMVFQAMKKWILEFPDEFMMNKYLRYFGMPLHDKRPELRAEGLEVILQSLARVPDAYSRLHLFLQYFAQRFVEMTSDVDMHCTELAVRVVAMMVRGDNDVAEGNELLTDEMVDRALLTIFDDRPTIRAAAGILMKVFVHCRTADEETEDLQVQEATQLLCSFALTLRAQYMEEMPEKYIIDAVWSNERPPLMLTQYKTLLDSALSATAEMESVVPLNMIAALLLKLQNKLSLGPVPKDDRRGGTQKKPNATTQASNAELVRRLSEDVGVALASVLEKHRGSVDILQAVAHVVAALDLTVFTSQHQLSKISALLTELRKATMNATLDTTTVDDLSMAWQAILFTDHVLKKEGEGHVQEMRKLLVKQVAALPSGKAASAPASSSPVRSSQGSAAARGGAARDEEAAAAWRRMYLISSLVSMSDQWPFIKKSAELYASELSLSSSTNATATTAALLSSVLGTAVHSCLWQLGAHHTNTSEENSLHAVQEPVRGLVELLLHVLQENIAKNRADENVHNLQTDAFVYLCDLAALNVVELTLDEQSALSDVLNTIFEQTSEELSAAQETLKAAVTGNTENNSTPQIAQARLQSSRVEAKQVRLAVGVSRLLLFKRIDVSLAPRVLCLWVLTPSKAVSDVLKSLFHALRDRAGQSFALERDVLVEAYNRCAQVGATPAAVDTFYQTGSKLASLHFVGTDRFYDNVVDMVRFGIAFSLSTDPLFLHVMVPYCAKLRQPHALQLMQQHMAPHELFTSAANPYVRLFISAMRRAAKVDEVGAGGLSPNKKRPRTVATGADEDDGLLAEIARGAVSGTSLSSAKPSESGGQPRRGMKLSMASRVVTQDGWHVPSSQVGAVPSAEEAVDVDTMPYAPSQVDVALSPGDLQQTSSQRSKKKAAGRSVTHSAVDVPTVTETAQSSVPHDLDGEVFIATQEYE